MTWVLEGERGRWGKGGEEVREIERERKREREREKKKEGDERGKRDGNYVK